MAAAVDWGVAQHDGKQAQLFTLTAASGATVTITTYGATLTSIRVPDRAGQLSDVLLGYDNLAAYEAHDASFGCVVGRFANRIAKGKFKVDGEEYNLVQNNGPNCLHGGTWGFSKKVWDVVNSTPSSLMLRHESPDMDEGFPGKLVVTIEYVFASPTDSSTDAALVLRYGAECDKATVVNLTNHAYFNLAGHNGGPALPKVLDHIVTIRADTFIPTDDAAIPFGSPDFVENTPFDFRAPARVGDGIDQAHGQLIFANGYDHSYVMANGEPKEAPDGVPNGCRSLGVSLEGGVPLRTRPADCNVLDPSSGRFMETFTEEPAVQFYTGNFLAAGGPQPTGKEGVEVYGKHTGLCFEAQHFPDSPNQPAFPTTVLRPGKVFTTETVHWFGVEQ